MGGRLRNVIYLAGNVIIMTGCTTDAAGQMENLNSKEKHMVNEHFQQVCVKDGYLHAVYEGNADSLERVLESYLMLISSASFVRSQTHQKSKNHKRFSNTGKSVRNLFSLEYRVCFQQSYMKDVPVYVSLHWKVL